MIIQKTMLLGLLGLFAASAVPAEEISQTIGSAKTILSVSPEQLSVLEKMHKTADEMVLKNDLRGAIRVYQDILFLEPDDEVAYTRMGQLYLVLGLYKRSYEAFKTALEINPENATAMTGIQTIMDPDGMQGMITSGQIENESVSAPPLSAPETTLQENPVAIPALPEPSVPAPPKPQAVPAPTELSRPQQIQMALKNAGFYAGAIDGSMDPGTKSAVVNFQSKNGLEPDGIVGSKTWVALEPYLTKEKTE